MAYLEKEKTRRDLKSAKLYAFWRYDKYPYVVGGTITVMRENGWVECKEYGPGHCFKPLIVLPVEAGRALRKQLDSLDEGYREAQKKLHDEWMTKALAVHPITKVGGR